MPNKDRGIASTLQVLSGKTDNKGRPLPAKVLDNHDWRKYLLARDMETNFTGPAWVPFSLWNFVGGYGDDRQKEIARVLIYSPGVEEIWKTAEKMYEHPNSLAVALPLEIRGIFEHWERLDKAKPSDFRTKYLRLKANALALATEISRINELQDMLTGEQLDFMSLYSPEQRDLIYRNVRLHNLRLRRRAVEEEEGKELGFGLGDMPGRVSLADWEAYNKPANDPHSPESPINHSVASTESIETWGLLTGDADEWPGIFPPLSDLLKRLADYFDRESDDAPLKRPAMANAKRNFVARRLCFWFRDSCGFASPALIAKFVCLFFEQGISDDEVSQMIQKMPGGNVPQPPPGLFD